MPRKNKSEINNWSQWSKLFLNTAAKNPKGKIAIQSLLGTEAGNLYAYTILCKWSGKFFKGQPKEKRNRRGLAARFLLFTMTLVISWIFQRHHSEAQVSSSIFHLALAGCWVDGDAPQLRSLSRYYTPLAVAAAPNRILCLQMKKGRPASCCKFLSFAPFAFVFLFYFSLASVISLGKHFHSGVCKREEKVSCLWSIRN